jgi:selenocysteine lyase/cysteine desulfurase
MSVPGLRREDFPVLDRLTYLNTASAGLVPASVVTPAHEFEFGLAQAGTTGMDEDTEVGILEDARQGAAELLGADPDTIAIGTSFTEALCQVAWWLKPGAPERRVIGGGLPQRHLPVAPHCRGHRLRGPPGQRAG